MISEVVYPELRSTQKLKASGSNFSIWKSKIGFVLFDIGVSYVLSDPKPADPTDDTPLDARDLYQKWISDDFTCRHVMLGAMEDDLFLFFDHRYKTAKAMMDALTDWFVSTSSHEQSMLYRKYKEHKMSEETPIRQHIFEMGIMARELEEAGWPFSEEIHVVMLMSSLPESWKLVTSDIMSMDQSEFTLENASKHLRIEADLRALNACLSEEEQPSKKKQKKVFRGTCYTCGEFGHCQSDCPARIKKFVVGFDGHDGLGPKSMLTCLDMVGTV